MGKTPVWNMGMMKNSHYLASQDSMDSSPASPDEEKVSVIPPPASLTVFGPHNPVPRTPPPSLAPTPSDTSQDQIPDFSTDDEQELIAAGHL